MDTPSTPHANLPIPGSPGHCCRREAAHLIRAMWVVQPYFFYTRYGGLYNDNWRLHSATVSRTIIQQTFFVYGLTSRIDIGIAPQWLENASSRDSLSGFGDLPIQLGFQVLKGDADSWLPHVLFPVRYRYHDLGLFTVAIHEALRPACIRRLLLARLHRLLMPQTTLD